MRAEPATPEELERAKENVKARIILALESSSARMNRLGGSLLYGLPLLEPDELVERIDAVTVRATSPRWRRAVGALAPVGGGHRARRGRVPGRGGRPGRSGGVIRVAVAGAAGRMGRAVCAAVDGADDLALAGQADPALGTTVADVLEGADVLVDFTQPGEAIGNARVAPRPASTS